MAKKILIMRFLGAEKTTKALNNHIKPNGSIIIIDWINADTVRKSMGLK